MIPKHICIVPDGNRRWAKARGKNLYDGYKAGMDAVENILKRAIDYGVEHLTFFVISTENTKRAGDWLDLFKKMIELFIDDKCNAAIKEGTRIRFLGDKSVLGSGIRSMVEDIEARSSHNTKINLNFCFGYGGRRDIVSATKNIIKAVEDGELDADNLTEDVYADFLCTKGIPDPDFMIRTSGEKRISNFLLWQLAYTELYFTQCFWPDFSVEDFDRAITDFQNRKRRFGT